MAQVLNASVYLALTILSMFVVYLLYSRVLLKLSAKTSTNLDDIIVNLTEIPLVLFIGIFGSWFAFEQLTLAKEVLARGEKAFLVLFALNTTWLLQRLLNGAYEVFVEPRIGDNAFRSTLFPVVNKAVLVLLWAISTITTLHSMGFDLTTILAGFGLAGFAFAVATRVMIENVISGIYIMSADYYQKGDRIIGGKNQQDMVVVSLGFLSTRFVDFFTRREVTIANSDITSNPLTNVSREPLRWVRWSLKLCNKRNSTDQLNQALQIVEHVVEAHENAEFSWQVYLESDILSHQLDVKLGIKDTSCLEETRNEILLEVLHRFEVEGIYLTQYDAQADGKRGSSVVTFDVVGSTFPSLVS